MPEKLPIITGWAPFHCAERLSGKSTEFVVDKCLHSLSRVLRISRSELESLLAHAYWHDWQSDPLSRGAYSYPMVGGAGAAKQLARPIENTLWLAGEAADAVGRNGTVTGAIGSGRTAALGVSQVLER